MRAKYPFHIFFPRFNILIIYRDGTNYEVAR
jgi:hypothetical protein